MGFGVGRGFWGEKRGVWGLTPQQPGEGGSHGGGSAVPDPDGLKHSAGGDDPRQGAAQSLHHQKPVWTSMDQYGPLGPIWTSMDRYGSLGIITDQYGPVRPIGTSLDQYGP